jgi:hypothetical protein
MNQKNEQQCLHQPWKIKETTKQLVFKLQCLN